MTPAASAVRRSSQPRARRPATGARRAQTAAAMAVALPQPAPRAVPRRRPAAKRVAPKRHGLLGAPLQAVLAAPDHPLLERLIRGRVWIGLVAFALIGIVAMQLLVLKLNTGIGKGLQEQAQLQRENATLSIANSTAAAGEEIEPQAAHRGMQIAPVGAIHFMRAGSSYVASAASVLRHSVPATHQAPPASSEPATASSETEAAQTSTEETPAPQTAEAPVAQSTTAQEPQPSAQTTTVPAESSAQTETQSASSPAASAAGGTQAAGQG